MTASNHRTFRRVVLAALVCLGMQTVLAGEHSAAQAAPETGLTIVPATSPEFETLLDRYYPGLSAMQGFSTAKPYMAILENTSGVPVRAFSLRFDCIARPRLPSEPEYVKFVFDPLSEYPGVDRNGKVFAPKEVRLLAPGFLMESPAAYLQSPSRFTWALPRIARYQLNSAEGETTPYTSISVDAVILSTHHMRGPNQSKLFQKYQAIQDARRSEWKKTQSILASEGDPDEVAKQLKADEAMGLSSRQSPTQDPATFYKQQYLLAQGSEASRLKRLVQKRGTGYARHHVKVLLQQPVEQNIVD